MKKVSLVLVVCFIILFSCNTNKNVLAINNKEINYIPYYLKVAQAKKMYEKKEYEKSFALLDSLFARYDPINTLFINEMDLYSELSVKFKKGKHLKRVLNNLIINNGYNLALFNEDFWVEAKKIAGLKENDLREKFQNYQKNINIPLRDSIVAIFKIDQAIRKTKNNTKIDSVDKIHEKFHLRTIKKYGYPNNKLVGGFNGNEPIRPSYMSAMLKHLSLSVALELQPLLLEELKKGNCSPEIYGGFLDVHKAILKEQTDFEYYGTYRNIKPIDTIATNNARELIGLPRKIF